jgi:sarcosine oxidase, subunit alpha
MLARGQSRIGDTITVWHLGSGIEAEVVKTPFYDPSGERVNGDN